MLNMRAQYCGDFGRSGIAVAYTCMFIFSCVSDVDENFKHVQLASMLIICQKPSHDCFPSPTLYTTCRNLSGAATTRVAP